MSNNYYAPKETFYNGITYHSATEADIAAALDTLGIRHQYECRRFNDSSFVFGRYTPDFWLPDLKTHVEVTWKWDERHAKQAQALLSLGANVSPMLFCKDGGTRYLAMTQATVHGWNYKGQLHDVDSSTGLLDEDFTDDKWDGVIIARCKECGGFYFMHTQSSWTCPLCGRTGAGLENYGHNLEMAAKRLKGEAR